MIVICKKCNSQYDDEFRLTTCPHNAFPANDGKNNFKIHDESPITTCMIDSTYDCESCQ